MKRVLVIGGAGFMGAHLVDRLVADGNRVRVLDRVPVDLRPRRHGAESVENLAGDFVDLSAIDAAVREIDVAYHLVSTTIPATSNVDPAFDVHSNLIGTLSFLKSAQAAGVKRIVFVSSGGTIYGNAASQPIKETDPTEPVCSYGITKLAIEKYLALYEYLYGLRFVAFRVANAFGEKQRPGPQGVIGQRRRVCRPVPGIQCRQRRGSQPEPGHRRAAAGYRAADRMRPQGIASRRRGEKRFGSVGALPSQVGSDLI